MKIKGIKETCLYIEDVDKTEAFYGGILGLELYVKKPGKLIFFRAGEQMLLCFVKGSTIGQSKLPPHYAQGSLHFAFEVSNEDYNLWKEKLLSHDIAIEHEQKWKNNLESFYFRDPDGHLAEILQEGVWD
jgi:catechol 2,3-dioxygenase-like lactoylglutathione lyase family enzyme